MLSTRKSRVAHPPAVDVGATIICESEEVMEPTCRRRSGAFRTEFPWCLKRWKWICRRAAPFASRGTGSIRVKPVEVAPNHWRWELKDMQALNLRDVPSPPEWAGAGGAHDGAMGRCRGRGQGQRVARARQWVTELEADRPDPSPEITAKVQRADRRRAGFLHQTEPDHGVHPEEHSLFHRGAGHRRPAGESRGATSSATATATARTRPRC